MNERSEKEYAAEVAGFVMQRRSMVSEACGYVRRLGEAGGGAAAGTPEGMAEQFRGFSVAVATVVHPDVAVFFRDAVRSTARLTRRLVVLAAERGVAMASVELAVRRDLVVLESACQAFDRFAPEDQRAIRASRSANWEDAVSSDPLRLVMGLPGTTVLSLEAEWVAAQGVLAAEYGEIPAPDVALVDQYRDRLAGVEQKVETVRRTLSMASSALVLPEEPGL